MSSRAYKEDHQAPQARAPASAKECKRSPYPGRQWPPGARLKYDSECHEAVRFSCAYWVAEGSCSGSGSLPGRATCVTPRRLWPGRTYAAQTLLACHVLLWLGARMLVGVGGELSRQHPQLAPMDVKHEAHVDAPKGFTSDQQLPLT